MKFEVLSTIIIDTQKCPFNDDGAINTDKSKNELLQFVFKTDDLGKIVLRGGPSVLRVDDKNMMIGDIGVTFTSDKFIWYVLDTRRFFLDCVNAYVKARNFELGVLENVRFESV